MSGRLFGFSAFTMLLPQALMGVGAVALLYAAVRRCSGPAAGLIAGAALALTPVAALMFRFNNPDALLVLLLVAAAYCVVRAIETASTRWMALAGCALGFAFLTKMLQAFLVVPGLALAFLVAAPVGLWPRIWTLMVGAGRDDRVGGLVRRAGQPVARRLPAVHRRLHRQQPAAAGVGLQRHRAHRRQAVGPAADPGAGTSAASAAGPGGPVVPAGRAICSSAATPASAGCSARRWVPRRPGCCLPR